MHDVFFFTDIHGMYDLYHAIIEYCKKQDPEATIIFGGDACDRGPDGYKIIQSMLSDPYIIYLKGNHEDLFVQAALRLKAYITESNINENDLNAENVKNFITFREGADKTAAIRNHVRNGGLPTLKDWILDGMKSEIIQKINHLPYVCSYENMDFCHAGGIYESFIRLSNNQYIYQDVYEYDKKSALWSRGAFQIGWCPNRLFIHGHTPVNFLSDYITESNISFNDVRPVKYRGNFDITKTGYKMDFDTCVVYSNKIFLYNCTTNKITGFYKDKITNTISIEENILPYIEN